MPSTSTSTPSKTRASKTTPPKTTTRKASANGKANGATAKPAVAIPAGYVVSPATGRVVKVPPAGFTPEPIPKNETEEQARRRYNRDASKMSRMRRAEREGRTANGKPTPLAAKKTAAKKKTKTAAKKS